MPGDINAPLPEIDRTGREHLSGYRRSNSIINQPDIIDIYRTFHPMTHIKWSFVSANGTLSKIFGGKTNLSNWKELKFYFLTIIESKRAIQ